MPSSSSSTMAMAITITTAPSDNRPAGLMQTT